MVHLLLSCAAPSPEPTCEPGRLEVMAGVRGVNGAGDDGLLATETWLSLPQDVSVDLDGGFLLGDYNNHRIRAVDPDGRATTLVGSGFPSGGDGGPALEEPLDHPTMALRDGADPAVVWFAATGNHRIGRVAGGEVTFPYGDGVPAFGGDGGPAGAASFWRPSSLAFADDGTMVVSDRMNQVVRAIDPVGTVRTLVGTPGVAGYTGDGGPATQATLSAPESSEMDPGNRLDLLGDRLVLADTGNHVIREVDLASGDVRTLAGDGRAGFVDGDAAVARFSSPRDVALAADGTVYVADAGNVVVRAVADGRVTTVAEVVWPAGVAVAPDGALWIVDRDEGVVYRRCP